MACAVFLLVCLDTLDDHVVDEFQIESTIIQDAGYIAIGLMLMLLLMLMIISIKDQLKLKELEKDWTEYKESLK